jgi:PPOX class probable FMN-dependent enzyme
MADKVINRITNEADLRTLIGGDPQDSTLAKIADRLTDVTRRFIDASPLVCVATASADGGLDVSPKGDPAGFVHVLDERTLLLPDRPGNRIADTLRNLLSDDRIALLFLIPGVGDTFRVNGRAVITDDRELLAPCAVKGRAPSVGILVTVQEAYTHCPKAIIRAELWNPERHTTRSQLPTQGEVVRSLHEEFDAEGYDRDRAGRYERGEGLY